MQIELWTKDLQDQVKGNAQISFRFDAQFNTYAITYTVAAKHITYVPVHKVMLFLTLSKEDLKREEKDVMGMWEDLHERMVSLCVKYMKGSNTNVLTDKYLTVRVME